MKSTFSVKGWDEFQHYKDRNPPWIKLHNHLLDDYEFECLGDAAKGHLLCIWMLASRTKNEMPFDEKWITKKIGASTKVNLQALVDAEFLIVEHDASTMLHNEAQLATVSVPSEEKRRGETETEESRVEVCRFAEFWDLYGKKSDSSKCKAKFSKLSKGDIELIFERLPAYIKSTPDKQYRKNPITWLNGQCWNDEIMQPTNQAKSTHTFETQNYTSGKF